ncbi:MAG: hypothetical protein RJB11_2926, partial [Planctomycetota bacterium]
MGAIRNLRCQSRAGDGTRTRNLLITNQLLCQLSYAGNLLLSVHSLNRPADFKIYQSQVALVYKSALGPQGEFFQDFWLDTLKPAKVHPGHTQKDNPRAAPGPIERPDYNIIQAGIPTTWVNLQPCP